MKQFTNVLKKLENFPDFSLMGTLSSVRLENTIM